MHKIAGIVFCVSMILISTPAFAFCGFFVSGADSKLVNEASQVALMRKGNRTIMSMSNNYRGPAEDFALVVPVPVVLNQEQVRTLPHDVFEKIDRLSAPRLVEYWEQDPCYVPEVSARLGSGFLGSAGSARVGGGVGRGSLGVTVEAKFAVGEYDILLLSAKEAHGLEKWLKVNRYNIPDGASDALAPYIAQGMKFFVAKVNIEKVKTDPEGGTILSPLRFDFEDKTLRLPVRLGLLNATGVQDLLIYILHPTQRYEVANYNNAFIPTNVEVEHTVRNRFGEFYNALFDETLRKAGGNAVVTEYAWQTSDCDPCPVPPLKPRDMATLGGDILTGPETGTAPARFQVKLVKASQPDQADTEAKVIQRYRRRLLSCFHRAKAGQRVQGTITLKPVPGSVFRQPHIKYATAPEPMLQVCLKRHLKRLRYSSSEDNGPNEKANSIQYSFKGLTGPRRSRRFNQQFSRWVLTRLHTRYSKETLSEDLVFQPASPITGGRGSAGSSIEPPGHIVRNSPMNQFQGRYIMRNYWQGPVQCKHPQFGRWGGPPHGKESTIKAATKTAWAPRGELKLSHEVVSPLPEYGLPGNQRRDKGR